MPLTFIEAPAAGSTFKIVVVEPVLGLVQATVALLAVVSAVTPVALDAIALLPPLVLTRPPGLRISAAPI